ncbi:phenylalanine--tRNA ligase subunit beta [Candidatus Kaiserbacteria bacterium]|nr:phenylalanine--tRNA ligase subunit beta [Candidatus Kaiserbacteria bacterium]
MKISRKWLQNFFDAPLPPTQELADALTFHVFEIDGIEQHEGDDILDVKVTANRGHDCLSYRGIAKELSAILQLPLVRDPLAVAPALSPTASAVTVTIEASQCARYIAAHISGVAVGPSPYWLIERLAAMGQRSVNNVVDATNFVMFDTGQPLHAFDAGKLAQKDGTYSVSVRAAREGESLLALDEKTYALTPSIVVICDRNADVAIGAAGVKGGMPAGITEATASIIIESANFDGPTVRKAAQHMKIRTDASARFEQGLSPELAAVGMRAVVDLILKIAGGTVEGFVDAYPAQQEHTQVSVSLPRINAVLGLALTVQDVVSALTRLGLPHVLAGDAFIVTSPFERLDILIPEDLIEEIGRIIGYDKVPAVELPAGAPAVPHAESAMAERIREFLVAQGFTEVLTSVFADKGERVIANKVDGVRPYLRTGIADGLAAALEKNVRNKDLLGIDQVKLFEIGTVWKGGREETAIEIAVEKKKKAKTQEEYRAGLDAFVASLSSTDAVTSSITMPVMQFSPYSKYPFIVRDIAMWVPAEVDAEGVLADVRSQAGALCVRAALFDRFEKEGKVSLAFRLVFQSFEKTLTDDEVNAIMERITTSLTTRGFETR